MVFDYITVGGAKKVINTKKYMNFVIAFKYAPI